MKRYWLSLYISGVLLVGCGTASTFDTQTKAAILTVDLSNPVQNDFLGVNAVYHGFAFMQEQIDKGMNDADRIREFSRVENMRLNVARTWYRPNYACPNGLGGNCDWNSTRMQALYSWLREMKNRNVDVALNLGWWFTGDTYYGDDSPDPAIDMSRFAAWVSESLHQIIEVNGFNNVKYGILFTEPTDYESGIVPDGHTQWSYYVEAVKAIHNKLVADGRRRLIKLVGPNNSKGASHLADAVSQLNDEIDIYGGHNYDLADYNGWFKLCSSMKHVVASTGKAFWLDEWGRQDEAYRQTADYGNYVAQGVAGGLNAGAQTTISWLLFDQQYVSVNDRVENTTNGEDSFYKGVHRWGFARWPHDTIADPAYPYPAWYAFSLLSKYLPGRNGTRVYQTTNDNDTYISAIKTSRNDYSFLVVNGNTFPVNITVDLGQSINRTLFRYLFDPATVVPTEAANIIGFSKVLYDVGSTFADTIPPRAVVVYSSIY